MKITREGRRTTKVLADHTLVASSRNPKNAILSFYIIGSDKAMIRLDLTRTEMKKIIDEYSSNS